MFIFKAIIILIQFKINSKKYNTSI